LGNRWRALRRKILTPNVSATSLEKRGFHRKDPESQALLEKIGTLFLGGYADAVEASSVADAQARLAKVEPRFRGFAYEGAGMGYGMLDGLPFGHRHHNDDFLAGPAADQIYIVYCGVGWAMARLPRFRWPAPESLDPLLRWLVLDGFGFHQAYFRTRRYVHEHYQDPRFPWPDDESRDYANRALDHGIGRALWFVGCTDVDEVVRLLRAYPARRHGDLWAGIGLASTYACGADRDDLVRLADLAGEHRPQLAQGSAFAAEARVRSGLLIPPTEVATKALCGQDAETVARICVETRPEHAENGALPTYELWRQSIANELVSLGGVSK
jgi:enediyne biosynthesis protein E3